MATESERERYGPDRREDDTILPIVGYALSASVALENHTSVTYPIGDIRHLYELALEAYRLRALLATQPEDVGEPTWRDIETAPKDGTRVLLFTVTFRSDWAERTHAVIQIGYWTDTNDGGWVSYTGGGHTHWMPLPAPPTRHPTKEADRG